jgi:hypothetical protein
MFLAWMLAALFLFSDALLMRDYLDIAGHLGLRGDAEAATPLRQAYPAVAIDAMTWVRHALSLLEDGQVRLRHTSIDNAPDGREVHWNSGWAWAIAGAGRAYQWLRGGPIEHAVEKATIWLNPFAFMIAIVALSSWTARHAGAAAGIFIAAAMVLSERIEEGFLPSYVDHHGLLTVCVLGVVLGCVAMGGGLWREGPADASCLLPRSPSQARAGALLSASTGALGLWISAASVVPTIAFAGFAGMVVAYDWQRRGAARGEAFDAHAWRLWGRIGGLASLAFYLAEYFPGHMGWHLEVNHPLYALAWLGGGELVARVGERRRSARDLLWPSAAVLAVPVVALVGGPRVLAFADPFLTGVHRGIGEFRPLWSTLHMSEPGLIFRLVVVDILPLAAAAAMMLRRGRGTPVAIVFATLVAAALETMVWWQTRWDMNSSAAQIPLALLLIVEWTGSRPRRVRWWTVAAFVAALYLPGAFLGYMQTSRHVAARSVMPADAGVILNRDIARTLRAWKPNGDIVVLASPNVSSRVGYYGRFATLGTLYWENNAGLKAAAEVLSEERDDRICSLLASHGVTHVVFVGSEEFLAEFYVLLHPDATPQGWLRSLGGRITSGRELPPCVRPLPYEVPPDLREASSDVRLFSVVDPASMPRAR